MAKITKFDRTTIRLNGLHEKVVVAVTALAAEHGLKVEYAGGKFDDLNFTAKVKFTIDNPGLTEAKERETFSAYCVYFGLKPEHFGARFMNEGHVFELVGLELKRDKYPLKGRRVHDGKILLFNRQVAQKISTGHAMAT